MTRPVAGPPLHYGFRWLLQPQAARIVGTGLRTAATALSLTRPSPAKPALQPPTRFGWQYAGPLPPTLPSPCPAPPCPPPRPNKFRPTAPAPQDFRQIRFSPIALPPQPLYTTPIVAGWSSPVARQAHNLKVTGSNPVPATKIQNDIKYIEPDMNSRVLSFAFLVNTWSTL